MKLQVREISQEPSGCDIQAIEADAGWRNTRSLPRLFRFLRAPEVVEESTVRRLHEDMKSLKINRAILVTSSSFSRSARTFADTRPVDLMGKDKLSGILKEVTMD